MKAITIRLRDEDYEKVKGEAEKAYLSMSAWVIQRILSEKTRGSVEKKVGRPPLTPEEVEERRKARTMRRADREFSQQLNGEEGELCQGSGGVVPFDPDYVGFTFPFGICEECHHSIVGFDAGEGMVKLRVHKDRKTK